jgi:hypothetical protein
MLLWDVDICGDNHVNYNMCVCVCVYRVSQEECARELKGYRDNGQRSLKL